MKPVKLEGETCTIAFDECRTGLKCQISNEAESMSTCQRVSNGIGLHERCTHNDECESMYCHIPDCNTSNPYQILGVSEEDCKQIGGRCQLRQQAASRLDWNSVQ